YGHQLSSFDLSLPTLADDPRPVLTAIQSFIDGKESPYARQQRMADECEQALAVLRARLSVRDRQQLTRLLDAAQSAARTREDALFDVGLAWTPMHRCALELGRRLTGVGVIAKDADVFSLTLEEIRALLEAPRSMAETVAERQTNALALSKI